MTATISATHHDQFAISISTAGHAISVVGAPLIARLNGGLPRKARTTDRMRRVSAGRSRVSRSRMIADSKIAPRPWSGAASPSARSRYFGEAMASTKPAVVTCSIAHDDQTRASASVPLVQADVDAEVALQEGAELPARVPCVPASRANS